MSALSRPPLHVEVAGPPHRPVVLFVHPLGASLNFWDAQASALSRDFCVVRVDLPGHGRSAGFSGAFDLRDLAQDILSVIDRLGISAVHYCGLSIGGMIGMWLAIHHASRLRTLTLSNCLPYLGAPQMWEERAQAAMRGVMREIAANSIPRWVSSAFVQTHPAAVAGLVDTAANVDNSTYAAYCRLLGEIDLRDALERIATPTLVIAGTQDVATPLHACEAMAGAINQSKIVALAGAHFCNLECSEPYTATLSDFIRSVAK